MENICLKCNKPITQGKKFCAYCGHKIVSEDIPSQAVTNQKKTSRKEFNKIFLLIPIIIILIIIICYIAKPLLTEQVDKRNFPVCNPTQGSALNKKLPSPTNVAINNPVSSKGSVKKGPINLLKENYIAINNRDFKKAYNLRSKGGKAKYGSYDKFYKNWETNITISLEKSEVICQTDKKARVKIRLYSEDKDEKKSGIVKAYYKGVIYLTKEDGKWKIDAAEIEKESTISNISRNSNNKNTYKDKQVIEDTIYKWAKAVERQNLSAHMNFYADRLDLYFGGRDVSKDYIWETKKEAFGYYDTCEMSVSNMNIDFTSNQCVIATFDKEWNFVGKKNFAGKERQRVKLKNFNGEWKITGEEELEVYWVKN